ncbi:MAG: ABC transporter permease [Gemmatimonadota bacterium]
MRMLVMLERARLVLRAVFLRRRVDREMQDEMDLHLARATARLMARGLTESEARRAARQEFGHVDSLQEQARDARGSRWIESAIADLRFGLRHFAKTPRTTVTMVVLLALGIGVNVGLFTLLYSMKTQPPPGVARNDRLVRIRGLTVESESRQLVGRSLSYPELHQYAAQTQLFSAVAGTAHKSAILSVSATENSFDVDIDYVTPNYFRVLGIKPILGAGLPALSIDDPSPPVAVISHALWARHFGQSHDVIGMTITVNGVTTTIAGVAPVGFHGTWNESSQYVWLPLNARVPIERSGPSLFASYDSTVFRAVALLQPGIRAEPALTITKAIAGRVGMQSAHREETSTYSADIVPLLLDNDRVLSAEGRREQLLFRFALTVIGLLILVVTCTNVSTLLIGLAVMRQREIAVRISLGAGRGRLVRQLVTESVLLAGAAGALAIGVIWTGYRAYGMHVSNLPLAIDWIVLGCTFAFAIATGIVFGASPALHATRTSVADVLKNAAGSVIGLRSRLHSCLVVAQIACTQPLLVGIGAAMFMALEEYGESRSTSLEERIVLAEFTAFADSAKQEDIVVARLRERIGALPGVVGVALQTYGGGRQSVVVHPADRAPDRNQPDRSIINLRAVSPGYFTLLDLRFLRGRDFTNADIHSGNPVVIGGELSRQLFGSADPIGRRLAYADDPEGDSAAFEIVGVVDDSEARPTGLRNPVVYSPRVRWAGELLIRTQADGETMLPLIRSLALAEVPDLPLTRVRTIASIEEARRNSQLRAASAAAGAGLVALFLSAIGLYAIISFAVRQRTREIGIRTALGADRGEVVGLFFFRGIRLSLIGLVIGLPLSIAVLQLLARSDGDIADIVVYAPLLAGLIAIGVISVAGLATWVPARAAARVDPLHALRAE